MTPREEFKLCFGVARSRRYEDSLPQLAGLPRQYLKALETACWAYDKWDRRQSGRILQMLKEKRNPLSNYRGRYNCRCSMRPIILDDKTGS